MHGAGSLLWIGFECYRDDFTQNPDDQSVIRSRIARNDPGVSAAELRSASPPAKEALDVPPCLRGERGFPALRKPHKLPVISLIDAADNKCNPRSELCRAAGEH